MNKPHFPIIRNGRCVEFKSDSGQVVPLTVRDSTRIAWFMTDAGGQLLKVDKALVPKLTIDGVAYSFTPKPRVHRQHQNTLNASALSAELKKAIGKEVAKLEEAGKKMLADMLAGSHGQRLRLDLSNGYQLVIGKPASAFRKKKSVAA